LAAVGLIAYAKPFRDYDQNKLVVQTSISNRIKNGHTSQRLSDVFINYALILWIILLCYFPTWVNIASGQFGLFLLGSVILIWLSARKEKYLLAGVILGIAMSVKIFLGLFLIFFAAQRRWRVLFWAASIFIICNIVSLSIFGLSEYKQHLELLKESHLYINASWNASFSAFFTRIFGGAENIPFIDFPVFAYGVAYSLSFLLILLLIRTAWPQPQENSPLIRFDIGYSLTIVAMLLISPFGWMYYFPSLIIPLLVLWHASSTLKTSKLYKFLIVVAWILSCLPTQLINSEETLMDLPIVWFITSGYYFYALIIFCGLLLCISHQFSKKLKVMTLNNLIE
jgi:MFS family permease